jgi:hypothetical protein
MKRMTIYADFNLMHLYVMKVVKQARHAHLILFIFIIICIGILIDILCHCNVCIQCDIMCFNGRRRCGRGPVVSWIYIYLHACNHDPSTS